MHHLINQADRYNHVDFKGKFNFVCFKETPQMDYQSIKKQNLLLFEGVVGSHSYGLNVPGSDVDYRGVYLMPHDMLLGMTNSQGFKGIDDAYYYELSRFVYILMKNSPHALEMLALPATSTVSEHYAYAFLRDNINVFITSNIFNSYTGYALSELHKFNDNPAGLLKHAMHGLRGLIQLIDFFEYGEIRVRPSPDNIAFLMAVRKGEVSIGEINAVFDAMNDTATDMNYKSGLKDKHDLDIIDRIVVELRKIIYSL